MSNLVPFTEQDFPRLIRWIKSPELLIQWSGPMLFTFPLDQDQLKTYIKSGNGDLPKAKIYKVVGNEGDVMGHIELGAINRENGTASICRVYLDQIFRGQGICAQMVYQILSIGFDELGLRRIDLRVYSFNRPAISCYEQAGMVKEGLLRKALRVGDQFWDTVEMAMLYEEWECKRKRKDRSNSLKR